MMRNSLLVSLAVVALAACHRPSLADRARAMGQMSVNLGAKVVAVVRPAAPQVDVDVRGVIVAQAQQTAQAQLQQQQQVGPQSFVVHHSHTQTDDMDDDMNGGADDDAPTVQPASTHMTRPSEPAVTVRHVDASRPYVVGLRAQTFGGHSTCKPFSSVDACNAECTSMLRATMLRAATADDVKSCTCTEGIGC